MHMKYLQESRPLGTAGALSLLDEVAEPVLVINGDIVTDLDFRTMRQFHAVHGAAATIAVARYDTQIPYGVVQHDGVNVTGIVEKPMVSEFINAGIYLIEPRTRAYIPRDTFFNMTDLIERLIAAGERVILFPVREYWMDIGRPADYERVQNDLSEGMIKAAPELPA
jgi:NDP-sugar pyrophosphorylase family protein